MMREVYFRNLTFVLHRLPKSPQCPNPQNSVTSTASAQTTQTCQTVSRCDVVKVASVRGENMRTLIHLLTVATTAALRHFVRCVQQLSDGLTLAAMLLLVGIKWTQWQRAYFWKKDGSLSLILPVHWIQFMCHLNCLTVDYILFLSNLTWFQ